MQLRTKIELMKLLNVWDGRETEPLHFAEIKKVTGWNNRKTNDMLAKAVKEGYIDKYKVNRATLYRNKIADYRGYFDTLQFLMRVDAINRKRGTVFSVEHPLYSFVHFHILAYGIPPSERLTPLEREMLFNIFSRLAGAFNNYTDFCDKVQRRKKIELTETLPDSIKGTLFSKDDEGSNEPISIRAANQLYGDVLWEHVFSKIIWDIRFALEKASLDSTGPIELLNCEKKFSALALKLAKRIYNGELSAYDDPDPDSIDRISLLREVENPFEERDRNTAIVLTPSPETIEEFANQVGKIVRDEYLTWNNDEFIEEYVTKNENNIWYDLIDFGKGPTLRRDLFKKSLSDALASMRGGSEEPFSKGDRKFILSDKNLTEVFSKKEILVIISKVEDIIRRAKKFYRMIDREKSIQEITSDPEWFTDEELHDFHLAQNVHIAADWKESYGTLDPIPFEMPVDSEEMREMAKKYQQRVERELKKRES